MPIANVKTVSIRFIRYLVGLQDEFYTKHLTEKRVFGPILDVLIDTLPRDNLVSSASLELFEHIKKENLKELVKHLVLNYRERLVSLSYLATFRDLVLRYDQTQGFTANMDYYLESEDWNTSDPEDEEEEHHEEESVKTLPSNGPETPSKPLVDYPSDEDSDETGNAEGEEKTTEAADSTATAAPAEPASATQEPVAPTVVAPPERLSEKRRREEDEDDELGKLMQNKRRSSGSSESNPGASPRASSRRNSFSPNSGNGGSKKISISLSTAVKTGGDSRTGDDS